MRKVSHEGRGTFTTDVLGHTCGTSPEKPRKPPLKGLDLSNWEISRKMLTRDGILSRPPLDGQGGLGMPGPYVMECLKGGKNRCHKRRVCHKQVQREPSVGRGKSDPTMHVPGVERIERRLGYEARGSPALGRVFQRDEEVIRPWRTRSVKSSCRMRLFEERLQGARYASVVMGGTSRTGGGKKEMWRRRFVLCLRPLVAGPSSQGVENEEGRELTVSDD